MMQTTTKLGLNRTGVQMSPVDMKKMQQAAEQSGGALSSPPQSSIRESYLGDADPVGSVPIPATLKGMAKSARQMLTGHRPQVLIDKLGERLAFERSGVRLYEAMLSKCQAAGTAIPDDMLQELTHIKEEEGQHFKLVHDALVQLGGDPTAMTPSADVVGVESIGLVQVVTDARTTIPQSLHAILGAELMDNAGWEALIALVRQIGQDDLAARFETALLNEEEHLAQVKSWLLELQSAEISGEDMDDAVRH